MAEAIRVRVVAGAAEARRLCARLTRGGLAAELDDGSLAEVMVVAHATAELLHELRPRARMLVAIGQPGAALFAAGADDVVPPREPELLFRRVRAAVERLDLRARVDRLNARCAALEAAVADAAHDIRNPLHVALGHAELLTHDKKLDGEQRDSAEAVLRQCKRALQLAERILEGARRQRDDELRIQAVQVGELVSAAVEEAAPLAASKEVKLSALPPSRSLELRGDTELLRRVLDNLIGNALRATPRGGRIEVAAFRAGPRTVRLAVKDSGEGIDPEMLPRLLAGMGSGRGLRICRQIADRHGGELWAESKPGVGTQIFVDLPLQPPSTRPRVLLVSDDEKWRKAVSGTLRAACEVHATGTAEARLTGKPIDLVLIESGADHARRLAGLRAEAEAAQVPVIELPSHIAATRLARTLAQIAHG